MSDRPSSSAERLTHWDGIYGRTKAEAVGWYQSEPVVSLAFIGSLGVAPEAGIVDVGGGASTLVDRLVSKGFSDLTVLDISRPRFSASPAPRPRCSRGLAGRRHLGMGACEPTARMEPRRRLGSNL